MNFFILLVIFIIIIIFIFFLVYIYSKKSVLSDFEKKDLFNKYKKILNSNISYKEKIIDFDKLFHLILQKIGYIWSFWDILKQNPKEIININKIWELHKLRNKLVHDFDLLSDSILRKKVREYEYEIKRILW